MAGPNEIEIRLRAQMAETAKVADGLKQIGAGAQEMAKEVGKAEKDVVKNNAALEIMDRTLGEVKRSLMNAAQALDKISPGAAKFTRDLAGIADAAGDAYQGLNALEKSGFKANEAMTASSLKS